MTEQLWNAVRAEARNEDAEIARLEALVSEAVPAGLTARVTGTILDRLRETGSPPTKPEPDVADPPDELRRERERRVARAPGRTRRGALLAGSLALAAAAGVVFWLAPSPGPALPTYAVAASGGVAVVRGPAAAAEATGREATLVRLSASSELRIVCQPADAVTDAVAARAFAVGAAEAREVHPAVRIASSGAVELRVPATALRANGAIVERLRVAVGRPRAVGALDAASAVAGHDSASVRWLTVPLSFADP